MRLIAHSTDEETWHTTNKAQADDVVLLRRAIRMCGHDACVDPIWTVDLCAHRVAARVPQSRRQALVKNELPGQSSIRRTDSIRPPCTEYSPVREAAVKPGDAEDAGVVRL
ncbi:hypothetical protein HPB52_013341 [Rhipicephalus sanguineus]|uniref:Uncharacterized protein n=1 Tax=Rhipicephalus sanguineus TaxID=34632 RepID=A0A9D4SQ75_RHISA|nr:hypothetical protein HPB52_013341 [Rhipicephalus sanguineus]